MAEIVAVALLFAAVAFLLRSMVRTIRAGRDLAREIALLKKAASRALAPIKKIRIPLAGIFGEIALSKKRAAVPVLFGVPTA
jgi:hypothetical protein